MKSKDFALIAVSVVMGIIFSIIVSKFVFSKSSSGQQVEVVPKIAVNFQKPDSRYFNSGSIDLTQFISIGNNSNPNPFNSSAP